ncbi:Kelch repeat-containing protein [Humisphaera borealis]|uniref:DUF4198 domain-containing protein n=1 Tax=Humisphaera borealis TaxID=2807512 RepID=A0A7M2WXN5_9BACT|nr:kelch repeat-containing protein [Humisphaera borealis]QOV90163.1 hypothetical protein IPV69_01955 [Humisphaera borealis]
MLHRTLAPIVTPVLTLALVLLLGPAAHAHFIFVVPEAGGDKAKVIMSEDLTPDPEVKIDIIAGAKLSLLTAAGDVTPVTLDNKVEAAFLIDLPGQGTRVVFGSAMLGVRQKGDAKPYLLAYYPKTIVGDAFDPKATLGDKSPVELIPVNDGGKLRLKFVAAGKPVEGAEITLILPDGSTRKPKTDKDGLTESFEAKGRYGAWTKTAEPAVGEHNGSKYEEVRRYAMLVMDTTAPAVTAAPAAAAINTAKAAPQRIPSHGMALSGMPATPAKIDAVRYPAALPIATSSFGAAALDGFLYYYGGHVSRTHSYSVEAVTGQFARLNLADKSAKWETLPGGPGLQGMNLVAHGGKIYRVGGMAPRNFPGTRAQLYSVADVVRFDPATKTWDALPSLPEPRSSHDIVTVGDTLVVVGGWNMNAQSGNTWSDTTLTLDLKSDKPQWKPIKQPFIRRALIATVHEGLVYVIGGLDEDSDTSKNVDILNPATGEWSTGPELPGKTINGFSPAACVHNDRLYVSVADGTMYVLSADRKAWEKVGVATPRIVHRLIPHGPDILIVGGAMRGENLDLIESLTVARKDAAEAK